jgi:hypothetical protein
MTEQHPAVLGSLSEKWGGCFHIKTMISFKEFKKGAWKKKSTKC